MGGFSDPLHVCCERQQLQLMVLYDSFGLTVTFNQWVEETKQMKACSLFREGIVAAVLNVGSNFRLCCRGKNTFLGVAGNGGVSQQEHRKLGLLKLKKKSRDSKKKKKKRKITLGKNLTETGRGAEVSKESSTCIHLSLVVCPWKAHGTVVKGVYLLHDS